MTIGIHVSQGGFINFLVGDILLLLKLIVSYYTSSCSHVFVGHFAMKFVYGPVSFH